MSQKEIIKDLQSRIALHEDTRAYSDLHSLLFDRLYRRSLSLVKSRESAEEVVSDVFVKLWERRARLQEVSNLELYLYTITRNISLNYLAKVSNEKSVHFEAFEEINSAINQNNPEAIYISNESVRIIEKTIGELPSQCKVIFQLIKEEGMRYKDAASMLHISAFTVRNQLVIATRKIASALMIYES